ncbi:hypothetical protein ES703_78850 [subsurface metagenome]
MPRIEEMYAFVAEDSGPDDEGVVAMSAGAVMLPLVGADMARVESLKPIARDIAAQTGKKIKLLHFTHREEIEGVL